MIILGKRFSAEEALQRRMIDKAVNIEDLMNEGMKLGKEIADKGENRENMFALKNEMYKHEYECCLNSGLGYSDKVTIFLGIT